MEKHVLIHGSLMRFIYLARFVLDWFWGWREYFNCSPVLTAKTTVTLATKDAEIPLNSYS